MFSKRASRRAARAVPLPRGAGSRGPRSRPPLAWPGPEAAPHGLGLARGAGTGARSEMGKKHKKHKSDKHLYEGEEGRGRASPPGRRRAWVLPNGPSLERPRGGPGGPPLLCPGRPRPPRPRGRGWPESAQTPRAAGAGGVRSRVPPGRGRLSGGAGPEAPERSGREAAPGRGSVIQQVLVGVRGARPEPPGPAGACARHAWALRAGRPGQGGCLLCVCFQNMWRNL